MGDDSRLEWAERMWGYLYEGAASFEEGYLKGKEAGNKLEYVVTTQIADLDALLAGPDTGPGARHVPMTGRASCPMIFGQNIALQKGATFGLYFRDQQTNERRMSYDFQVIGPNGTTYTFSGYKRIVHDAGTFDILQDHTTLYATLQWQEGSENKTARGIIYFHPIPDLPPMLLSMLLPGSESLLGVISAAAHLKDRLITIVRFFLFVSREASQEYLKNIIPSIYEAEYRNWVCKGTCEREGVQLEFFLFSGIHPKGFPWGGDTGFSDIGLIIREGSGDVRRFALSDRTVANLELDFNTSTQGRYNYDGDMFEVTKGYQLSFADMRKSPLPDHLRKVSARLEFAFTPRFVERKNVPFEVSLDRLKKYLESLTGAKQKAGFLPAFDWLSVLLKTVEQWIKALKPLGYSADIYTLSAVNGSLAIDGATYNVKAQETLAEGEYGRLSSFTVPALYYNYFCAVEPARGASAKGAFRVQIRSGVLRPVASGSLAHWFEEPLGKMIGSVAYMDYEVVSNPDGSLVHGTIEPKEKADSLILHEAPLLEINNNHYPGHRTFQRRIVSLPGTTESGSLGMEENMSVLDLTSQGAERSTCVAAVKNADRFAALDQVLEATGFFSALEAAYNKAVAEKQKTRETFSIVIKPNFSFMYSLTDISTFTDPALVKYLIARIRDRGFRNITLVEAESTYATFFTNRDVETLARYVGYTGSDHAIVNLSRDYVSYTSPAASAAAGKPTRRDVHPVWRDADFRISFAKNKTHAYAYYTLTIKNIYGALPRSNKFKEYHCNREEFGDEPIYTPAIELIQDFPVHFGFIDAYFSADGIFGVFADKKPDFTGTIIGGEDLVAVDWVGASKMGLDPQLSTYMRLAIKAFGKPEIRLVGDYSLYPDWQNLPVFMPKATTALMDRNYSWGLIIYASFSMMDPFFQFKLTGKGLEVIRLFSLPVREALLQAVSIGELSWEALSGLLSPPSMKDLQQLLDLLTGAAGNS